jgi:hypothetical protein
VIGRIPPRAGAALFLEGAALLAAIRPTIIPQTGRLPTKEEIAEALGIAVTVNAGAAIVYSTRTLDAFAAAAEG